MCTVIRWKGRNVIDYLKLLDAKVTHRFGGGVLVCLDDDVVQFPLHQFLRTARRLQLDVASPAVIRDKADHDATNPCPNHNHKPKPKSLTLTLTLTLTRIRTLTLTLTLTL